MRDEIAAFAEVPAFRAAFLRVARADFMVADSYRPDPARAPLQSPLTAFTGEDDPWAPPSSLSRWRRETSAAFDAVVFPGGHFYLLDDGFERFGSELLARMRRKDGG
jgi:surfactin synthase thioesterase subunit